jgi:mannose/fructose/N-acetylgalactosamine-specific phosphotransferase system component IIB
VALRMVRVDDRLIHGQITTFWTRNIQANTILVADDKAANDPLQSNLMKIAAPNGVDVEVLEVSDAAGKLKSGEWSDKQVLLLLRSPISLLQLVDAGVEIEHVNVGNVGGGEGKVKLTKQVAATPEEMDAWFALDARGVPLEVQWLPGERKTDLNKILQDHRQ